MSAIYRLSVFPPSWSHTVLVFLVLALLAVWNLVAVALVWAMLRWPDKPNEQRGAAAHRVSCPVCGADVLTDEELRTIDAHRRGGAQRAAGPPPRRDGLDQD